MTDPTYDPRIPITELNRSCADLAQTVCAHSEILDRIQARLTDLERAPKQAASERAYFRSELEDEQRSLAKRIDALVNTTNAHGERLNDLESAAEFDDDAPTGYEPCDDAQLLAYFADQNEGGCVDPDLFREAAKRKNAR